jgi:hypothetical protein
LSAIYYDTEFLEDGHTIDLISIGMVTDDGLEYYAVCSEIGYLAGDDGKLHTRISGHKWLMRNVIPHLPVVSPPHRDSNTWTWALDTSSALVKPHWVIANEVRDFIQSTPDPELWADYGAYDHVALCQLWGSMMHLPQGIPMWTHDLRQEAERLGVTDLPPMPGAREHNALYDAREVRYRHHLLSES